MKTAAIIAEYNPFHTGHAYQIEETRRLTGADYIIAVMSGDFVQRGAPAILDKFTRTGMALYGGADLVVELPVSAALSSAEGFATGGVSLIDALSCVDYLSFGSECGDIGALKRTAQLLNEEPNEESNEESLPGSRNQYREFLKSYLKEGLSYPAARQRAFTEAYPDRTELEPILESPNNILALEYLLALQRLTSTVQPITIRRAGAAYHEKELDSDGYSSASAIRAALEKEDWSKEKEAEGNPMLPLSLDARSLTDFPGISAIPYSCRDCFYEGLRQGMVLPDDLTPFFYYRLLDMTENELLTIPDVSSELAARILSLRRHAMPLSSFALELKTKQYTRTRIDRILMRIVLKLDAVPLRPGADESKGYAAPYARILGFRRSAAPLLKELHENSRIPVIQKLVDAEEIIRSQSDQPEYARKDFQRSLYASSLYRLVREQKSGVRIPNEYERGLVMI